MNPKRTALLVLAAVGAFLLSLIALLPASIMGYFLPPQVSVGLFDGSVWHGSADGIVIANRPLGALDWKLRPLQLLRGRLALDAQLHAPEGEVSGKFSLGFGRHVEAQDVELRWPLAAIPSGSIPRGWNADIQGSLKKLVLDAGALTQVVGVLDAHHLERGPPDAAAIGSYRLTFDENSKQADKLVGRLQDTDGPIQVNGTLTLTNKREFVVDGVVATRPGAAESIQNTLRYLGNPDANGLRPFSVAGNY